MKKFLPILLAALLLIPAMAAEAAYVTIPNFGNITRNNIEERTRFLGMEQNEYNGVKYTRWTYQVVDGKANQYFSKYIKRLNNKHSLQLVGQDGSNWYFRYTGGQAKYLKMLDGSFHIHVGISGNYIVVDMVAGMYPATVG